MKLSALLSFVVFFLIQCSKPSDEELLIADRIQNVNGVKTDLKFKMIKLDPAGMITGKDSLDAVFKNSLMIFSEDWSESYKAKIRNTWTYDSLVNFLDRRISIYKNAIQEYKTKIEANREESKSPKLLKSFYLEVESLYQNQILDYKKKIYNDSLTLYPLKRYKSLEMNTLAIRYSVVYSIINPLLNNVKQEISKTVLFSPDKKRVIMIL